MDVESKIRKLYKDIYSDTTKWKRYGAYDYIYSENEVFLIRDCLNKTINIVRARSVDMATHKVMSSKTQIANNGEININLILD